MKTIAIIPARFASSRFPGKPLVDLGGKSMIQRVYEQVSQSQLVQTVVVATDDERIFDHVCGFGGAVQMTRPDHPSGTDRCAEVALQFRDYDAVVNVQGDEPFIHPTQIDQVIEALNGAEGSISTLARPILEPEELFNASVVKVVLDKNQRALYFSRSPIPHLRGVPQVEWPAHGRYFKHLGIYGFRLQALLELTALAPSPYEQMEALEQLRWLEAGYAIQIGLTNRETIGIDTPADLERARAQLALSPGF